MNAEHMIRALDEVLPDALAEAEVRSVLRECADSEGRASLEIDERIVAVPVDAVLEVVAKAFVRERHQIAFATGYRAQVAIGGVIDGEGRELRARYCFATVFFGAELRRITMDFHSRAVWI